MRCLLFACIYKVPDATAVDGVRDPEIEAEEMAAPSAPFVAAGKGALVPGFSLPPPPPPAEVPVGPKIISASSMPEALRQSLWLSEIYQE